MSISTSSSNILSFLLSLNDFSDSLTVPEQNALKEVGKQLKTQPKAWERHLQPLLLKTIQSNPKLNSSYKFYQEQLTRLDIPLDLLPKYQEIYQLTPTASDVEIRGFPDDEPAIGYQQQLNNITIVVCESDESEKAVKEIGSLSRLKRFICGHS